MRHPNSQPCWRGFKRLKTVNMAPIARLTPSANALIEGVIPHAL